METAKVFMSGRSQAVRIPKAYRFDTEQVYITKKDGNLILSDKPLDNGWGDFFDLLATTTVPNDFIQDLQNRSTEQNTRDPLADLAD